MNDTEAEARRLLAAATQDMPPGIDLLDGFVVARRRDRARRTRRRAMLAAGIAAAAASVTAVTLTIGSAPPALAAVTSAMTRTLAQSYHLTWQVRWYYIRNGRIRLPAHQYIACTIEADPVRHVQASSCADGEVNREVGGYTYFKIFHPGYYHGRHWLRIPIARGIQVPGPDDFTTATPQQMLAEIKKAEKVTVAGPASGPGWTGTRYAFSGGTLGGGSLRGTVNVDQHGRVRALALTIWFSSEVMTHVVTFSDFGAPVTVTPPPADQTVSLP